MLDVQAQALLQKIKYDKIFVNGSPHQIPPRTITLRVMLITRGPQPGSFKAAYIMNGNRHLRFFGSMESVRPCSTPYSSLRDGDLCVAGSGKSVLWFVVSLLFLSKIADVIYPCQFYNHRRYPSHVRCKSSLNGLFLFRLSGHRQTTLA